MPIKLSDELINISAMMMVARERGEIVHLASELNTIIQKAMEIEKAPTLSREKRKSLSAQIKFTKSEVDKMSKTFKKEFIANGCVARIIKRPSGKTGVYYEIRYRRNGYNITVSNKNLQKAKEMFVLAAYNLPEPGQKANNKFKLSVIVNEWLEYKKGKIAERTWINYCSHAKKYLPQDLLNKSIKDIRTVDLDRFMHTFDEQPRMYEEIRVLLNSVFKYARASGIIAHNPVELVPFKRAERKCRSALSDVQIKNFLERLKCPKYEAIRQCAYVLYFFGLRPCELDEEAHFENGFLICRNRKRKGGKIEYKKIPIPKQAQGLIDFDKPITFPLSYDRTADILREILGEGLTPYNLRHTFATKCTEAVRPDVVEIWMGDSKESLVGRVYVHFTDEYMKEQMDKVRFLT